MRSSHKIRLWGPPPPGSQPRQLDELPCLLNRVHPGRTGAHPGLRALCPCGSCELSRPIVTGSLLDIRVTSNTHILRGVATTDMPIPHNLRRRQTPARFHSSPRAFMFCLSCSVTVCGYALRVPRLLRRARTAPAAPAIAKPPAAPVAQLLCEPVNVAGAVSSLTIILNFVSASVE